MQRVNRNLLIMGIVFLCLFCVMLPFIASRASWVVAFDATVGDAIHSLRCGPMTAVANGIAFCFDTLAGIVWIVGVALLLLVFRRWTALGAFAVTMGGGQALQWGMKFLVGRPRPTDAIAALPPNASFPSGHTVTAFLLFLFLWYLLVFRREERLGHGATALLLVLAVFLSLFVGFSRIYLGVHWPTDVLGGALLATGVFCVGISLFWGRSLQSARA